MRKIWDHVIEVKEGFIPRKGKVYPLLREERKGVREFIRKQLQKGYIWPLKSPQMVPVFFVGKKDGKKQMVQDYQYLNEWTIKNNYPSTPNIRCVGEHRDEESIHKNGFKVEI